MRCCCPPGFPTRKASFPFLQRYAVLLPPGARAAALDPDLSDKAAGHLCRELLQVTLHPNLSISGLDPRNANNR